MSYWPDSVLIGGAAIPLGDVRATVAIHHGRDDVYGEPQATTCQVTLLDVGRAFVRDFQVGQPLQVTIRDGAGASIPRFTGTVTDGSLDVADLTAIAVGRLSTLGGYRIGETDWPIETWSARVRRIFAEAGLDALLVFDPDPAFDPELAARTSATAGATTLGDYLAFLAPMVGAAVTDGLDGTIHVQALGARTIEAAVPLAPADVEYAPVWTQALPLGNIVTVRYTGDQSMSVTLSDPTSIALYGPRPATLDTTFTNAGDATTRAQQRLQRGAYAHWNILQAPILRGLPLDVGAPVILSSMPDASPFDPWTPLVEGWSDTIDGADWTQELTLSDPVLSGIAPLPWADVPAAGYAWNQIDQAAEWREALTLATITP